MIMSKCSNFNKKYILFNVDLDLYSQTKRTVLKKQKRDITERSHCTFQTDDIRNLWLVV